MTTENAHNHPAPKTQGRTIPWASFYDTIVKLMSFGKDQAIRKASVVLAQISPGDKVLDVGCGTGDLTLEAKKLAGPGGEVYGIDASPNMIRQAGQKAGRSGVDVTFKVGLIENIEFPENQFDVVLSSLMMHHLPDDLKHAGLSEIYRVLKPGGRLLIVDMQATTGGSLRQRLSDLMITMHGGHTAMQDNVTKQIPFVKAAGFTTIETDKINRQFSYILAWKPDSN
jgi:ubiquinone/menaquinone biosynthesis C-methylase UbiE